MDTLSNLPSYELECIARFYLKCVNEGSRPWMCTVDALALSEHAWFRVMLYMELPARLMLVSTCKHLWNVRSRLARENDGISVVQATKRMFQRFHNRFPHVAKGTYNIRWVALEQQSSCYIDLCHKDNYKPLYRINVYNGNICRGNTNTVLATVFHESPELLFKDDMSTDNVYMKTEFELVVPENVSTKKSCHGVTARKRLLPSSSAIPPFTINNIANKRSRLM